MVSKAALERSVHEQAVVHASTIAQAGPFIYAPDVRYPQTRRESLVEALHGRPVPDPYRWLEDGTSAEVHEWIDAQNALVAARLGGVAERATIRARLDELLQIGSVSVPSVRRTRHYGVRAFFTRRQGRENQPILYVRDGIDGADRALVDPNAIDPDGTIALDWFEPSADGSLVAYGLSRGGTEESTLAIRDVESGRDLGDVVSRARHASVAWRPDSRRFFYTRYPAPGSVPAGEERYHRRVFEHELGRDPDADPLVFQGESLTDFPSCSVSPSGRWLLVRVHRGWSESALHLADLVSADPQLSPIVSGRPYLYDARVRDDAIYVLTNDGAPRYAIYRVDPDHPERDQWVPVVPEHPSSVIDHFEVIGDYVVVGYLAGPISGLEVRRTDGTRIGVLELPTLGATQSISGLWDGSEAFIDFESFAVPQRVLRVALDGCTSRNWQSVEADVSPDDYVVREHRTRSADGTLVPYLMVHKKSCDPSRTRPGGHPTILYGYGGFNVSLLPRFSRTNYVLLEREGIYVQANLRGGGEYGEPWHAAGKLAHKQNAFDDFFAVAEALISDGVTTPERLAIVGHSNGGLLVAAAVTQRPELFRAAVAGVPLTDMLRYHRFLLAKLWVSEYGCADDPEQFEWLLRYSPYHRVAAGVRYPAVLFTTALGDTRVDPMHARKMAAALQDAAPDGAPILLRTETHAGHGAGKPVNKLAEEYADVHAFLLSELGLTDRAGNH